MLKLLLLTSVTWTAVSILSFGGLGLLFYRRDQRVIRARAIGRQRQIRTKTEIPSAAQ